ncbi:putative sialic acid transporter [Indibacter alkaliphilus LW1]|uniref:Sialic acid transporter n=1 Tax=Indibacter alkaliphilus (strain CCUG 57479 / KCTC 22604 / LW1) TaxID=1189612 RepID=S2CWI1_INDAL|nr:sodium/solute symporter [Indibacter alkaliphilus]EOZ91517.1 putative sialic acid transporter [Indibacter alkaliphilus LW1]
MKNLLSILLLLLVLTAHAVGQDMENLPVLNWEKAAELTPDEGSEQALGYAGMYTGTHKGTVIMAGGANFPNGLPWKGGDKKWWNQVKVLRKSKKGYTWIPQNTKLPKNLAYGGVVSTENGVILLGGENQQGPQNDVYRLVWNEKTKEVQIEQLPDLPKPISHGAAAYTDGKVYLAGGVSEGTTGSFYMLDLMSDHLHWQTLPQWPGPERSHAVLVVQTGGEYENLYLFGGRRNTKFGHSEILSDAYRFDPKNNEWKSLGEIEDGFGNVLPISAFSAKAAGSGHILLFGGVGPEPFNTLEKISLKLSGNNQSSAERDSLTKERDYLLSLHPGFHKQILAFHTVTKAWTGLGELPFDAPADFNAVSLENDILLASGETAPGKRSPYIQKLSIVNQQQFGTLNYIVLGGYLGILVVMGFFISKKQHNVADFFKAGGRVPWWAAGISVFGTQLSAITFMAIPAKTFSTDWTLFFLLMTIIMISPVIIALFLPFFRRLNLTTAYEYLELRFNRTVRNLGSLIYVTLQFGRLGIVLLLPSLALSVVTGMSVELCILIMGVLSILYTVLGGIEAVIWTDVIQVLVLLGGALVSLVLMVYHMDMEWSSIKELALDSGKMRIFDTSFDFTGTAIWVVLIGGLASNLVQYGSDQTVIQRYLTTKDEKTAARGIMTGAWMALPSALIFFAIGTALYLFYLQHPQDLSPVIQNTDSIFPWYIVTQLPQGVSGLLIAAVFAAAMSSLDSSMNSVATVITTDFYKRWFPSQKEEGKQLTFARWVTVAIGVGGTLLALMMASMGIPSLWDQFNMLIGLFAGGLGGIFLIGILSRSVNGQGAVFGLVASALVQILVKYQTDLSIHLYAFTGLVSAMLFTYLFSLLFQKPSPKSIEGLTIHSLKKEKEEKQYEGVMAYRGK